MIETAVVGIISAATVGAIGALWYKMGKIETKVNLIYDNINIAVDWMNNNHK